MLCCHTTQFDATLAPLQAVIEWAAEGNPPGQRVAHILSIPAAAAESSLEDARSMLLPLLSQLAFDDHPDVKHATAEVLGPLGEPAPRRQGEGLVSCGGQCAPPRPPRPLSTPTAALHPPGPILAAKDPEVAEAGGSADAMDLLVLAHRLLQDGERGVRARPPPC